MRIGAIPENPLELLLTATGMVPTPLLDTFQAILLARTVMVATKLDVFEALKDGPATAEEVAARTGTDPRATEKLLGGLVGARYLRYRAGRFELARVARKWLLRSSAHSLRDNMLHRFLEWEAIEHFEGFVRTGSPLNIHESIPPEDWAIYQRGMRSLSGLCAEEVARRLPVPAGARQMLDVGGSHGYYSVLLCRRHPELLSTIIDLPQAIEHARPLLEQENMGDRIVYRAEDVLAADLGADSYDLVFIAQLLHHFDEPTNRQLMIRIARALRKDGIVACLEVLRPRSPAATGQTGALLDLYFATISKSGTWSLEEMADWQRQAGLIPRKAIRLRSLPGAGIQTAIKGSHISPTRKRG